MLVCAFAFSAYAGDIPCPAVTSEPPQVSGEIPYNVAGDMPNGVESTDTATMLTLLLVVLPVV